MKIHHAPSADAYPKHLASGVIAGLNRHRIEEDALSETALAAAEAFRKTDSADLTNVTRRHAKDSKLSAAVAQEHIVEVRRFLAVCAAAPAGMPIGMAGPVDDAWHTFLLFTRDYAAFCEAMGGFVHHVPDTDAASHARSSAGYENFLAIYERAFGVEAPAHVWPRISGYDMGGDGGGGGGSGGGDDDGDDTASACAGCGPSPSPGGCGHCSACRGQTAFV